MANRDLTPRLLAGLALGEDPAKFLGFRILPDERIVVVDGRGRKYILTRAELQRAEQEITAQRLKARGRALIEDLKNEKAEHGQEKAKAAEKQPAKVKAKPAARPKAKGKPPSITPKRGED